MLSIASAISEEIETLAWLNLSMIFSVYFSLYFYFGNQSSESSSFAPTYSTKSWNIYPNDFRQSLQISTLPSFEKKINYKSTLS